MLLQNPAKVRAGRPVHSLSTVLLPADARFVKNAKNESVDRRQQGAAEVAGTRR